MYEPEKEILDAIRNDIIKSVSISARSIQIENCSPTECVDETIPVIWDETALTYVAEEFFAYNGQIVHKTTPGMNLTKIYIVE